MPTGAKPRQVDRPRSRVRDARQDLETREAIGGGAREPVLNYGFIALRRAASSRSIWAWEWWAVTVMRKNRE